MATEYVIHGAEIATLDDFFQQISDRVIPGAAWGRNLDAFDDMLRGGFGTPEEGFTLRWVDSHISREKLGYPETARQLELRLKRCHPANREHVRHELAEAEERKGPTVFDRLLEIIRDHGVGGDASNDKVRLVLE